jgi:glycosyltransferase involved in cell wall biosynthesis
VHSHVHYPTGFILFLAALAGVRGRITHFRSSHDGRANSYRRRVQRKALKVLINHFSTSILAVSETAMDSAWQKDWRSDPRCQVIYNGIDPDLFTSNCDNFPKNLGLKNRAGSNLYIHIGRFDAAKNHQRLLSIFAQVAQMDLQAHLLLVGQGDNGLEQTARKFVKDECLQERVTFAGNRDDIPKLLSAADIMIFPSLWEGLPGAVLEVCAAGRPVLASDIPVILEISKYLPLLQHLPLDAPDDIWAKEAQKYCLNGKQPNIRSQGKLAFSKSPFTIQSAVQLQKAIWKGA